MSAPFLSPPGVRLVMSEVIWRAYLPHFLADHVSPVAEELVKVPADEPLPEVGLLSLVVRNHMAGRFFTPVTSWLARWNPWTWRTRTAGGLNYPYYLSELFFVALLLALVRAALSFVMREAAAHASVEAATRLRRAAMPPR